MLKLLIVTSFFVVSLFALPSEALDETGRKTPHDAFEAYKTATIEEDWAKVYSVVSPGVRQMTNEQSLVFAFSKDSGNDAREIFLRHIDGQKMKDLMSEFNMKPTRVQLFDIFKKTITNEKGLFIDTMKYFHDNSKYKNTAKYGKLLNIKIEENVAIGTAELTRTVRNIPKNDVAKKSAVPEPTNTDVRRMHFIKVDGRWYFATKSEATQKNNRDK